MMQIRLWKRLVSDSFSKLSVILIHCKFLKEVHKKCVQNMSYLPNCNQVQGSVPKRYVNNPLVVLNKSMGFIWMPWPVQPYSHAVLHEKRCVPISLSGYHLKLKVVKVDAGRLKLETTTKNNFYCHTNFCQIFSVENAKTHVFKKKYQRPLS